MLNVIYRLWFKLTMLVMLCIAIIITALWPHMYQDVDGFGIFVSGLGGYNISWVLP
jgi:hypothetical protein